MDLLDELSLSESDEETLAICLATAATNLVTKKCKMKNRSVWMKEINLSRKKMMETDIMNCLEKNPLDGDFFNFNRMSATDFEYLLSEIGPLIAKQDTNFRDAISPKLKLAVTLRFLASGDSYRSLHYTFRISHSTISLFIPFVCETLISKLSDFVKVPNTEEDWINISKLFMHKWNFPLCLGAIDGKHVMVQAPAHTGSDFYNYKGFFSIILMAIVDADYQFIYAECGSKGRTNDANAYTRTKFYEKLTENKLKLPTNAIINNKPSPYVFLGDDAFALSPNLMKPYPGTWDKNTKERHYNYRLSRARRVVENAFGILSSVFRVLRKPMLVEKNTATKIVMASVHLHNFLRRSKKTTYVSSRSLDVEENGEVNFGIWHQYNIDHPMTSMLPFQKVPRKSGNKQIQIRNNFAEYFYNNPLEWQSEYC